MEYPGLLLLVVLVRLLSIVLIMSKSDSLEGSGEKGNNDLFDAIVCTIFAGLFCIFVDGLVAKIIEDYGINVENIFFRFILHL